MLTPKQIEDARKQLGINVENPSTPTAGSLIQRIEKNNEGGFFSRVKEDFQERREELKQVNESDLSIPEKILRNAGQIAGGASDIVTELPGIKQGLELTGKGIAKIPGVEQVAEKYQTLPERTRKNLEAVGNIVSLVPVGVGAKGSLVAGEKAVSKVVKTTKGAVGATKKVAGEIIPGADRMVNFQVSKALDLTAGDIKNINLATGNEVGEFLATKNLIRGNKGETTKALQDFFDTNYKTVRGEINKVKTPYASEVVPRYKQSLQEIKKQVGETTGLEEVSKEIDTLLKKKTVVLDDVQRAKELLDEHFSLYKVTGDVKEGVAKQGMSNLRKELKEFIEKEVKKTTGADIATLNNEVSTAKSTLNAIEARSTKGLTASNIKIGDLGAFGVGSAFGGPLAGAALVAAKKILGTSAIRLKFAKWLDGISDAKKLRIQNQLLKGQVPPEVNNIINQSTSIPKASSINTAKKKVSISPNSTTKPKTGNFTPKPVKIGNKVFKEIPENAKKEIEGLIDYLRMGTPVKGGEKTLDTYLRKFNINPDWSNTKIANKLQDLLEITKTK